MVSHRPCCLFNYFFFCSVCLLQLRKPLIERKRRERINTCLDQLKETVIGAFRLDVSIFPHVARPHSVSKRWSLNQVNLEAAHLSTAIQTGEGRYPRDDSETPAEHPE